MHIGLTMFATEYAIPLDELAREAEARGFESLWVPEHTHIPTSRRTPFPGGGELPREYAHTLDPFVALAAAAAVTRRLRLGTGICLLIQRDTLITAKAVASLDVLSGGRFLFGVGGGWNAEEMEHHGTVFKTRFRKLQEQVRALKTIWTQEVAEFHGEFVNFDPVWSWPKPVQTPHPPVLWGGESDHTLRRVVEIGDGWFPRARAGERIFTGLATLRELAARARRAPEALSVSVFGAPDDPALLDRYRQAGVTRTILRLPSEPRDTILPLLDRYARLLR
jgi:probable F420-dependent oxidoreductase